MELETKIETVGDLKKYLQTLSDDTKVIGAWEGQHKDVFAYSGNGTLFLDPDNCNYLCENLGIKCRSCDKIANRLVELKDGSKVPSCYKHWPSEDERKHY